jgi:sugar/nucleoside kinase (ribokinase family)
MIAVIGAAAVDMVAARADFRTGTSNPAELSMVCGGVGYRVFRALDAPKCLISAVGTDALGTWLRRQMIRDGDIRLQSSRTLPTARYLAFMAAGKLLVAASDMRVIEQTLTCESVKSHLSRCRRLRFLVMEGNLSASLLPSLRSDQAGHTRLVFECVSVEKTLRHAAVLSGLYLLAGNREEVAAFAGGRKRRRLERLMREREIEYILETRGGEGASLYSRTEARQDFRVGPALPAVDTTGAGDRLLAELLNRLKGPAGPAAVLPAAMRRVAAAIKEKAL